MTLFLLGILSMSSRNLSLGTEMASSIGREYQSTVFVLNYMRSNIWICLLVMRLSTGSWNYVFSLSYAITYVSNTFTLSVVVHQGSSMGFMKICFCIFLVIFQFVLLILAVFPAARVSSSIHSSSRILLSTIARKRFALKWKLMIAYERLTFGPQYGVKVGFSTVNWKFMYFQLVVYIAYFMNFTGLLRN